MKTILLSLILAICCYCDSGYAQVTITGNDLPGSGRTNILAYDTVTNVNVGIAGNAPQVWDFSNLDSNYTRFAVYSQMTTNNQNQVLFPDADIYTYGPALWYGMLYGSAPTFLNIWGYMFFSSGQQGLKVVGFTDGIGPGTRENPQELLMGVPASLDSVFHDYSKWEVRLDKNLNDNFDTIYKKSTIKTLSCDAHGSLTTPFGTFDVIRVHEYATKSDSFRLTFFSLHYDSLAARDTVNNYYFWTKDLKYPVAVVMADKNNNVLRTEYLKDTLPNVYSVSGQVFSTNGSTPVTSGTASLKIKTPWNHLFTTNETVKLVNNGHFQFSETWGNNPYITDYLVFIDPDQGSYPYNIPTYYGDVTDWQHATVLHLNRDTSVTVRLQNDSAFLQMGGQGTISGNIAMQASKSFSTNADKVKVVLEENPGGATVIHIGADTAGNYNLSGIPNGNYKLRVEIAGLLMDSTHFITVSSSQQNFINKDFVYDTLSIYVGNNSFIEGRVFKQSGIKIFPNPFAVSCQVIVDDGTKVHSLKLSVFDVTGREVKLEEVKDNNRILFNRENLEPGIYLMRVKINDAYFYSDKLIVK